MSGLHDSFVAPTSVVSRGRRLVCLDELTNQIDSSLNALGGSSESDNPLVGVGGVGIGNGNVGSGLGTKVANDGSAFSDDASSTDGRDGDLLGVGGLRACNAIVSVGVAEGRGLLQSIRVKLVRIALGTEGAVDEGGGDARDIRVRFGAWSEGVFSELGKDTHGGVVDGFGITRDSDGLFG